MKGGTGRALLLACALATVATTSARAETAPGAPQQHVVKPGDTLWDISRQHYGRPLGWPTIGQRNAITEPRLLQPGRVLNLDGSPNLAPRGAGRKARAPAIAKATATRPVQVLAATGDVRWTVSKAAGGHGAMQPAQAGMVLPPGAVVRTGPDSFVTLGLPDGSRSTLPSQSEVRVAVVPGDKGRPAALLELTAGEVEARVPPRAVPARPGEQTFRVRTRMATVGVRGTHFRVALAPWANAPDGIAVGVQEGRVWVRGTGAAGDTELNAGQGLSLDATSPAGATQALLPAPELLDIGRAQQQPAVTIAWNAVPGAAGYRVQLARDPGFLDVFAEQRVA
ncbi:MAG: LysM peptidoglycan-binding domain-containing protein, partial [Comamonadaceae bacterium]